MAQINDLLVGVMPSKKKCVWWKNEKGQRQHYGTGEDTSTAHVTIAALPCYVHTKARGVWYHHTIMIRIKENLTHTRKCTKMP